MAETLLRNIRTIYGLDEGRGFLKGREMSRTIEMHHAWLLMRNDEIADYGPMETVPERAEKIIDAQNGLVLPAWCDSHTHLVFAAPREREYADRIRGLSYEEIAANGGGILHSARVLQETPEDELFQSAYSRLENVMALGTGAIEIKSGYGLSVESELKMLRVIRRLKETGTALIKATFLGAHAVPAEYREKRESYLRLIMEEMLPRIADEGLADYMDVFCDQGFFTVKETERLLEAGARYGLAPKIHANELANSGGVQVGIAHQAISVDHLEMTGPEEIKALLQSKTIPTVLPSCSFFLRIPFAPARQMIDAGLGIAIASDYNPGTSPSGNIPLLMAIASHQMRLLPAEVFHAVTINGACAMQANHQAGSIAPGKKANLILTTDIPSLDYMVYAFGQNHIARVWIAGKEMK
jgi:imidazolonepropionase